MSMESFWSSYSQFSLFILIGLGLVAIICLVRVILGPTPANRLVAVNMLGTITMAMIAVLLVRSREGYLADICLIYAMISFLAVIVLCKVYVGAYEAKKAKEKGEKND